MDVHKSAEHSTEQAGEVRQQKMIKLPSDVAQLEEANLPRDLATSLAGKEEAVELLWEKAPNLRRLEPWDTNGLIDRGGKSWSEHYPLQVFLRENGEKAWRLPRHWVGVTFHSLQPWAPQPNSEYLVSRQQILVESLHLPSFWDLLEINIPRQLAIAVAGKPTKIQVRLNPDGPVRVTSNAPTGIQYVIPLTWRRRRVQLPERDRLTEDGVPEEIAAIYAGRVVSVNYHPGSLCCLQEHYRFRDEQGHPWPVKIRDCFLVGYGDADEHAA
jgi:hypothetical protein